VSFRGLGRPRRSADAAISPQIAAMSSLLRSTGIRLSQRAILGFQKHAELMQFGEHTTATNLTPVDHAAIARACGAEAVRVQAPADLAPALAKALDSGTTWLIEVRCDPDARPPITVWDPPT
jgi:TPP-dependent trihydroxycyclohexane-1,2-dione (THcHDO) dehydratase